MPTIPWTSTSFIYYECRYIQNHKVPFSKMVLEWIYAAGKGKGEMPASLLGSADHSFSLGESVTWSHLAFDCQPSNSVRTIPGRSLSRISLHMFNSASSSLQICSIFVRIFKGKAVSWKGHSYCFSNLYPIWEVSLTKSAGIRSLHGYSGVNPSIVTNGVVSRKLIYDYMSLRLLFHYCLFRALVCQEW